MRIKVRNLEAVASTVQAVVREYHSLVAREERTKGQLARVVQELDAAEVTIAAISLAQALEASRESPCGPRPEQGRSFGRRKMTDGVPTQHVSQTSWPTGACYGLSLRQLRLMQISAPRT